MRYIVFFIDSLSKGAGTERITVDVANALVRRGFVVSFVLLNESTDSFFTLNSRIQIYSLHSSFSQRGRSIVALRQFLKVHKPDYLVNVAFQMAIISIWACIGLKCKIVTWDHFFLKAGSVWGYLMRLVSAIFSYRQVVLTKTDRLNYPVILRRKILCIPNFTHLNSTKIHSKLTSKVVLSVGRLDACKGFDLLIEAWKTVIAVHPDWALKIVGDGDDREELNALISASNLSESVSILFPTKDILSLYLNSSLYVLSSRFEPFGLVLIEAKSCGLPIVAFDCPYGPRNIVKDGMDGLLVKSEDVKALSDGISYLLSNEKLRKKMASSAVIDFETNWSEEVVLTMWRKLFV